MQHLDDVSSELHMHPLCKWIASSQHADPLRHYDFFLPALTFAMTFPFYNEQFLRYEEDELLSDDADATLVELQRKINEHAAEDKTHVALFLRDATTLQLTEYWGLNTASSLIWTLWLSPSFSQVRRVQSKRLRALLRERDAWPPFRYLHMEEIERDGNAIFSATTEKAGPICERTGVHPVYFGMHHLERETGHVAGHIAETATDDHFDGFPLSPEDAAYAQAIVTEKHELSMAMSDAMYEFAVRVEGEEKAAVPLEREKQASLREVRARIEAFESGELPEPSWNIRPNVYTQQAELVATWHRHHANFVEHDFAKLFRETSDEDLGYVLRCSALLLATRICAMQSFYRDDCQVENASADQKKTLDFICELFATEANIFMHDWDVLGMDDRIQWRAPKLLQWWFLDKTYGRPELEALHEFRRINLKSGDDPVLKYWSVMSVHFISKAFFGSVKPLAERFVKLNPTSPRLIYLEGVHHLLYDNTNLDWQTPTCPTTLAHVPVSPDQRERALKLMDVFATYGRRQLDNLARALTADRHTFAFLRD